MGESVRNSDMMEYEFAGVAFVINELRVDSEV